MAEKRTRLGPWLVVTIAFISTLTFSACGDKNDSLVRSAKEGRLEEVRELLKQGADVDAKADTGATALMWASFFGKLDVVKVLLSNGADVNIKDNRGWSALMAAAEQGYPEVMELLISKGADVNARNEENQTALTYAMGRHREKETAILKAAGARQ